MEGTYFCAHFGKFNTDSKIEMMSRMVMSSDKIKNHFLTCPKRDETCKFCQKIMLLMYIFLEFEKKENKKIEIKDLMEEVDEMISNDNFLRIISFV